ncbi:Ankyrin repeat-containing protein [Smittium mucronatum]|uniref:Ankyrin repeat-containing protein n=1 Tax=Smittium mucronatum TaxID=133383 RepID=A0A1R0H8T4_9FUNG|nr:Ankyrin repeat-containing protein [Smittium mucronatum]
MAENIWLAISESDIGRVKEFVDNKTFSVDSQDDYGYSPLHAAASWKNPEIVEYLLEKGANVAITDNDGDTPLHTCEDIECALLLLKAGADPKVQNKSGINKKRMDLAIESVMENEEYSVAKAICEYSGIPYEDPTLKPEEKKIEAAEVEREIKDDVNLDEIQVDIGEMSSDPLANVLNVEGLLSEETLNEIMSYIFNNPEGLDFNDEEAIKARVSEYLIQNLSKKNTTF